MILRLSLNEFPPLPMRNKIRILFIIIAAFISASAFFTYLNQYIIFNKAAGGSGSLVFPQETLSAENGTLFTTQLMLDTGSSMVRGTDVKIQFDSSRLELVRVLPVAKQTSTLTTFTPLLNDMFDYEKVVQEANKTGVIEFGAVTADLTKQTLTQPFKGAVILAELTFRTIQPGKAKLTIVHTDPTKDSTIIDDLDPPQNILLQTNELTVLSENQLPQISQQP